MKTDALKISVNLLERLRSEDITVLCALMLLYVHLVRGTATQKDFADRFDASRQQISKLFLYMAQKKLICCDVYTAPRGERITGAFKLYKLTEKGTTLVNKLLNNP